VVGISIVLSAGSDFGGSRSCEEFPVAYEIPVCVVSVEQATLCRGVLLVERR
jgi:hypothetical protein